jgi:hypothetical protein
MNGLFRPNRADFLFTKPYCSAEKLYRFKQIDQAYSGNAANMEILRKNTAKFTKNAISFL